MKRDREFYYTGVDMVSDLLFYTPIGVDDSVLDAGSGRNKVWFNALRNECKFECEIEDNCDYFTWEMPIDWVVGNPPFHESWKFFEKASHIARKGIAFLINNQAFNSWTPKRFEIFRERGFYLKKIIMVNDKRWFGRYYYMIFTKEPNDFMLWNCKTY